MFVVFGACVCVFSVEGGGEVDTFIAWAFLLNISSISSASLFTSLSPSISSTRTARSNSLYFCKKTNSKHTISLGGRDPTGSDCREILLKA